MQPVATKITAVLSSHWFFYGVLGFLVLQALWFVFTAMYPMAFDEDFHLGIIRIYAEQWSPFLAGQPEGADVFGAVARDPSYFYHYLMSFPYRAIASFTSNEMIQVILLRLINVGLFAWALVLFRRVLLRAKTSPALAHTTLAIFVLIPIVPQLAAHINYDNLLFVLIAWVILSVFDVLQGFHKRQVPVRSLALLAIACLLTSVVKYAALPLLLAAVLFVIAAAWWYFRGKSARLLPELRKSYRQIGVASKVLLLVALLAGTVLFAQRYGGNVLTYGHPVPDCGKVLTTEQCLEYGPWERNYYLEREKDPTFSANPGVFMIGWLYGMWHRLFFAVNGAHADFANYPALPFPSRAAVVIAVFGVLATVIWWRQVFSGRAAPYLMLFLLMIVTYVGVLWLEQFSQYGKTGHAVAINGRYLLPILPLMAAIIGCGIAQGLRSFGLSRAKPWLAVAAIAMFAYGGGVFTYILRSDETWYWRSETAIQVNQAAQDILSPVIIEGSRTYSY